jgi:hypothetical protein
MEGLKGLTLLLLVSAGVLLGMTVWAEDAGGATITVPDDHPTVHQAIDNATDHDTIFIKDGVYNETVVVWRPLTIMGESRDGTIIENGEDFALLVVAHRVHISNLTVRNHSDFTFAYIHQGSKCTVEDVVVRDSGNGIWVNRAHLNVFRRVECLDNHETGLWMDEADLNLFEGVACSGNGLDGARVVWCEDDTFVDCEFSGNSGHGLSTSRGVTGVNTRGLVLRDCVFSDNGQNGCDLYFSDGMTLVGCTVEDNAHTGIRADQSNDTVIMDCTVRNFTRFGIAYVGRDVSSGCVIQGNTVEDTDNSWSVVMARDSSDCAIVDNVISCNHRALSIYSMNDTLARGNDLTGTNENVSLSTLGLKVGTPQAGQGDRCHNVTVADCTVRGFTNGIVATAGRAVHIRGCTVSDCASDGILLEATEFEDPPMHDGSIEGCTLVGCGMNIQGMTFSTVEDNLVTGARVGMLFNSTDLWITGNVFRGNVVRDCSEHGLYFNSTNGTNLFYLNSLINNTEHSSSPLTDVFDDEATYGNYWDDYEERYPDANVVGRVWDTPYGVGGSSVMDRYPLAFAYDTTPPVADAGEEQGGDAGYTYRLNGSGSSDDGTIVLYTWSFTYAGTPVELTGEVATFPFLLVGSYEVTLVVEDAWGNTGTDTTMVHVHDLTEPAADAGEDVEAGTGEPFLLNGTGSTDNGIIVTWEWSIDPEGLDRVVEGETASFIIDEPGEYPVVLRVFDEAGNWDIDDLLVTVLDTEAPVADAGLDLSADQGEPVTMSGRGSRDNVGVTSWTWTFTEVGEVVVEVGELFERVFPFAGVYEIYLNVSDEAGNWDVDTMELVIRDIEPPVADAGLDITMDMGDLVTFDGSGSRDNVGVVAFNWHFAEGSQLKDVLGVDASYRFDVPGEYEVELQAYDLAGNVGLDWVIVTVADTTKVLTLGPFKDEDGPLGGVRVEADFGSVVSTRYTDDDGVVSIMVISPDDLVSPGSVVAKKDGWMTLEFEVELDASGDPIGTIPEMKRSVGDGEDDGDETDWLAWGLVIVLVLAYAGTLLYLSSAAKRAS